MSTSQEMMLKVPNDTPLLPTKYFTTSNKNPMGFPKFNEGFQFNHVATKIIDDRINLKTRRFIEDLNTQLENPSYPMTLLPFHRLTISFTHDIKYLLLNLASSTIPLNLPMNSK